MGHSKRLLASLVLIVICCVLTACTTAPASSGGGSVGRFPDGSDGGANLTSCSVITATEAGAALGQVVHAPVHAHATVEGGVACVFYGPRAPSRANPDLPVGDSVRVVLVTGSRALHFFDDYRRKVPAQQVAGLGQQAYWDGSASLSVLEGDDYIRISVFGVSNAENAEKALAADALQRM